MELIKKIIWFEMSNLLKSKWLVLYSSLFFVITYALLTFDGDSNKAMLSLMNLILLVIPLISLIFSSMYFYNSREFIEMLLCQPIERGIFFVGLFLGTSLPLSLAFVTGVTIPFLLFGQIGSSVKIFFLLIALGVSLNMVFSAIAFFISVKFPDKIKGFGMALIVWLFLGLIYDGMILFVVYMFADYPLEKTILILSLLNPTDLARILFLLQFDISALMGYTGAVFQNFFGSSAGIIVSSLSLFIWIIIPFYFGLRSFKRKDF